MTSKRAGRTNANNSRAAEKTATHQTAQSTRYQNEKMLIVDDAGVFGEEHALLALGFGNIHQLNRKAKAEGRHSRVLLTASFTREPDLLVHVRHCHGKSRITGRQVLLSLFKLWRGLLISRRNGLTSNSMKSVPPAPSL